jgi:hypothetical protein
MHVTAREPKWRLAIGVVALLACVAACASSPSLRLDPLTEPDQNASKGQAALIEAALTPCADLPSVDGQVAITAELTVQGVANGGRVRGRFWLGADLSGGSFRLEPIKAPPAFVLVARDLNEDRNDRSDHDVSATLRVGDGAIRQERSRELLQALLGVPLSARELIWVMAGCPAFSGSIGGQNLGPNAMRVLFDGILPGEIFVRRNHMRSPWSLVAMGSSIPGHTYHWRADYGNRVRQVFRHFRIRSREWNGVMGRTFDVGFSWSRVELGATLDERLFAAGGASSRNGS